MKVESVPCDFIFVGACNIQDLPHLLSPLRSRITGAGYEVLVETTMPDTDANRVKLAQFVAQEIAVDKRIPPASRDAVGVVIEEAHRRAKTLDNQEKGLSLRLRELGGLIRSAGDIAVTEQAKVIDADHVRRAVKVSRTIDSGACDADCTRPRAASASPELASKARARLASASASRETAIGSIAV